MTKNLILLLASAVGFLADLADSIAYTVADARDLATLCLRRWAA